MELRNQHQQLQMRLRDSFGNLWMAATAFIALCAGLHAIAPILPPPILSRLASLATFESGWPVAAILLFFPSDTVKTFFAAQVARSRFMDAAAERRGAYMARRSAARSAGQPRSKP